MNSGRVISMILIVIAFVIAIIAGGWLASQIAADAFDDMGPVFIGAGLAFIPVALFAGFGIYLFVKSGQEAERESEMEKQRQLLDLVRTRGQVSVHDLAIDMSVNVDQIKDMVRQLVGLQVFSGFVNWDDGILYSSDASKLRDLKQCEKCGAPIELAGKGVVVCRYCGTEYFLT